MIIFRGMKTKKLTLTFIVLLLLVGCGLFYSASLYKSSNDVIDQEPEIEEVIPDPIEHKKVYLAVGEYYRLDGDCYYSKNPGIAVVINERVKGISRGKTTLTDGISTYDIEVTDMITAPYISEKKQQLPCEFYTEEQNEYLDEVLRAKIDEKGYQTRAGAVEAARFLLLQFPYHMSYFSENGRGNYCDGEGRYHFEGLYLNIYKVEKEGFQSIINGPVPWGCRMFSNPGNCYQINSLDCSGFVTWCLLQNGTDAGDIGAGPAYDVFDCSDLGENHEITMESLDEVKVGDLFAEDGHISILIGIKDGLYYIAESNLYIDIRVRISTKEELIKSDFYAWVDMDEFYNYQDGNLTNYWEE